MVGVVDLEWSYAGPTQLFGSAPWWLLQDRLNNYDTFLDKEEAPRVLGRYLRNLDVFKTVLEEEDRPASYGAISPGEALRGVREHVAAHVAVVGAQSPG